MKSFDNLLNSLMSEQNFGASNVGATNPTTSAPMRQQNPSLKGPTAPVDQQKQPEGSQEKTQQDSADLGKEVMDFLERNKANPEFLNVIKKSIEELEKHSQQKSFIDKQSNTANATNQ
jgi:hypothetical protein